MSRCAPLLCGRDSHRPPLPQFSPLSTFVSMRSTSLWSPSSRFSQFSPLSTFLRLDTVVHSCSRSAHIHVKHSSGQCQRGTAPPPQTKTKIPKQDDLFLSFSFNPSLSAPLSLSKIRTQRRLAAQLLWHRLPGRTPPARMQAVAIAQRTFAEEPRPSQTALFLSFSFCLGLPPSVISPVVHSKSSRRKRAGVDLEKTEGKAKAKRRAACDSARAKARTASGNYPTRL